MKRPARLIPPWVVRLALGLGAFDVYILNFRAIGAGNWIPSTLLPPAVEKGLASALAAVTVVLFHELALALGAPGPLAVALALVWAFGSQAFGTCAQALWPHGPVIAAWLAAVLLIIRRGAGPRPTAIAAGVLLAAAGPLSWILAGGPAGDPAGWAAWREIPAGLAGLLWSPGRGLLVHFPVALLALPGAVAAWRRRDRRRALHGALLAGSLAGLLFAAARRAWHGGECFGPRVLSEIEPALLFLAIPLLAPRRRLKAALWTLALLGGWSAALQGGWATWGGNPGDWNNTPAPVDLERSRLADWRDTPFGRTWAGVLAGDVPAPPLKAYRARYDVPRVPLVVGAGRDFLVPGRVTNTGKEPWPPS